LGNVKGAIIYIDMLATATATKVAVGTYLNGGLFFSTVYNVAPGSYNQISRGYAKSPVAGQLLRFELGIDAIVPVVYDGGIPYISWDITREWHAMTTVNATYSMTTYLFLLGVCV